jgi:CheY-like chemotaxis protein
MPDDSVLHELGNILAVIAGQAEFLLHQDPGADPAEARDALEAIRRAALRGRDRLRDARGVRARPGAPTETPSPAASAVAHRILLVDDEEDVRDALTGLLKQAGHQVDDVGTGEDAIALFERDRFDCVITDLALPGLSGITLSRVVKDRRPDVFVILMTGSSENFEPAMVRAAGVDRLLIKPSGRTELLAAVAGCRRSAQASS